MNEKSKILIIGEGASFRMRELALTLRMSGRGDVCIVLPECPEGERNKVIDLLSEFNIVPEFVPIGEVSFEEAASSITVALSLIRGELRELPKIEETEVFNKIAFSEFKPQRERCYPKVPPKKLNAGKRR